MACQGQYTAVAGHLHKLVANATIGSLLFAHAIVAVIAAQVRACIGKHIAAMMKLTLIDHAAISKTKANIDDEIATIDNTHLLPHKREISGNYRGVTLKATTKSIQDEVNWRISLCWKGLVVHQNVLQKLWCEDLRNGIQGPSKSELRHWRADRVSADHGT